LATGLRTRGGILPPKDAKIPYVPPDLLVYKPESPHEVKEAFRITEALLRALRDESARLGAMFAVVVHNAPWAHDDARWRFMCARHPVAMKTWDRRKPNDVIDAFLAEEGIAFLDLFDVFETAKEQEPLFFRFDPHWRPAGHRIAARATADFLKDRDMVRE
jgi:hypothetical protein